MASDLLDFGFEGKSPGGCYGPAGPGFSLRRSEAGTAGPVGLEGSPGGPEWAFIFKGCRRTKMSAAAATGSRLEKGSRHPWGCTRPNSRPWPKRELTPKKEAVSPASSNSVWKPEGWHVTAAPQRPGGSCCAVAAAMEPAARTAKTAAMPGQVFLTDRAYALPASRRLASKESPQKRKVSPALKLTFSVCTPYRFFQSGI